MEGSTYFNIALATVPEGWDESYVQAKADSIARKLLYLLKDYPKLIPILEEDDEMRRFVGRRVSPDRTKRRNAVFHLIRDNGDLTGEDCGFLTRSHLTYERVLISIREILENRQDIVN